MSIIPDGTYTISLSQGEGRITDPGEGRSLTLAPPDMVENDADKIQVTYDDDQGAYSLRFLVSNKNITFHDEPSANNKLSAGDIPRYFIIIPHDGPEQFTILVAEDGGFHLGMAFERIYPPWVAMQSSPEAQAWTFNKV